MIKSITKWAVEVLSELRSVNSAITSIEDRQRQINARIKQIEYSVEVLTSCVDDGRRSSEPKKAFLTKHHKEGTI